MVGLQSTVSSVLCRDLGVTIVDADVIAREVVRPGQPALAAIVKAFGAGVLLPDGTLDRAALGKRVFSDPAARKVVNAATHSRIAVKILKVGDKGESGVGGKRGGAGPWAANATRWLAVGSTWLAEMGPAGSTCGGACCEEGEEAGFTGGGGALACGGGTGVSPLCVVVVGGPPTMAR